MTQAALSTPSASAATRQRVAVRYAIDGDPRFISHHDEIRALVRALIRARWPLAHSGGFNPAPRLSIPLPRVVGVAADGQLAVVEVTDASSPQRLHAALAAAFPPGWRLIAVEPQGGAKPHAVEVAYAIELSDAETAEMRPRLEALVAAVEWVVDRRDRDGTPRGPVDVRPSLQSICIEDGVLHFTLRTDVRGTARPQEILTALGLSAYGCLHRLRRTRVIWDNESCGRPAALESHQEGISLASQEVHTEEEHTQAE